jgi:hypothetical protein
MTRQSKVSSARNVAAIDQNVVRFEITAKIRDADGTARFVESRQFRNPGEGLSAFRSGYGALANTPAQMEFLNS